MKGGRADYILVAIEVNDVRSHNKPAGGKMPRLTAGVLLLQGVAVPLYGQTDREAAFQEMLAVVVAVEATGARGTVRGSGIVLTPNGIIVTAAHVLEGATHAIVRLRSGDEYPAEGILDADPRTDLVFLRIAGFDLRAARLGNSDSVSVGSRVIALGAPMGLEGTVTDGLVSAVRFVEGVKLLQISTPISPGSSGGGLFTESGALLGITVSGIRSAGAENLNFAVPVNYARGKLELLANRTLIPLSSAATATPRQPLASLDAGRDVNSGLEFDFTTLHGLEIRHVTEAGLYRTTDHVIYRAVTSPGGGQALERVSERLVEQATTFAWKRVGEYRTRVEITPSDLSQRFWFDAAVETPRIDRWVASGTIAGGEMVLDFRDSTSSRRVPQRVLLADVRGAALAALGDSVPPEVTLTVVELQGPVTDVRVRVTDTAEVNVFVARDGHCRPGARTTRRKLPVLRVELVAGAQRYEERILLHPPHANVPPEPHCIVVPGYLVAPGRGGR